MKRRCSAARSTGPPKFKKATLPVFKDLYKAVKTKAEAKRVLKICGAKNYQERLDAELKAIHDSEMWQAGAASRSLRPKGKTKGITKGTKGVGGRAGN